MTIEKAYAAIQKKHDLPSFEELDCNFEIADIEEGQNIVREIRKRIEEKLGAIRSLLEELLHPDTGLAGLHESTVFTEDEKHRIFDIYRLVMKQQRQAFELYVRNEDDADAAFIKESSEMWEKLKNDVVQITKKLQDSWQHDIQDEEKIGYFG